MYSEAQKATLQAQICERIANGEPITKILRDEQMPSYSTVMLWHNENKEFSQQYARARDAQADKLADQIIDIVDTEEDPARARVRMDARKWYAGKIKPKVYGDSSKVDFAASTDKDGKTVFTLAIASDATAD